MSHRGNNGGRHGMRWLTAFVSLFISNSLFGQHFNSIKPLLPLSHVSVLENTGEEDNKPDGSGSMERLDTVTTFHHLDDGMQVSEDPGQSSIAFSKPLAYLHKTSSYGYRFHPILKKWRFHSGVDFASDRDTIYSILSGRVKESGYSSTLGYYIRTVHSDGKIEVLYAHLSEYHYLKGQPVRAGEPLGITGSTGLSTGDHLHLAVYENGRNVDPISFMSKILFFNNRDKIHQSRPN